VILCDAYSVDFGPLSLPHSRFRHSPIGSYAEAKAKTLAYKACKSGMADDESFALHLFSKYIPKYYVAVDRRTYNH